MAIAEGVTEIQDSEDEPLSSSPIKLPEIHVDKLSAEESGAHQEPQDATQDCHGIHQAYAKHVGADSGDITGSAVDRNHSLGVFEVESNNEIQSNVSTQQEGATIELNRKYPVSDEALGMNNAEPNERLDFEQGLATAKLTFDIEGLEQPSISHVFSKNVSVARHSSPPQEHCDSSTALYTPSVLATEPSTTPKLECLGDRSQQVHANNNAQTEVSQPDNDTVSNLAVNAPDPFPTSTTEHGEHVGLVTVPIAYDQVEDLEAGVNRNAQPTGIDAPAGHHTPAQIAANAQHDIFHSPTAPIPDAFDDINNEQLGEAESEPSMSVEPHSTGTRAITPPPGDPVTTNDRETEIDKCDASMVVHERDRDTQASRATQNATPPTQVVHDSDLPAAQLTKKPESQPAQNLATSRSLNDKAPSAATTSFDTDGDPSPAAVGSTTTTYFNSAALSSTSSMQPAVPKTPQEITLAELKAHKAALLTSLIALPAVQVVIEEQATLNVGASDDGGEPTEADVMAAANKIVKEHIKLLHEYNELKDMGQGLMGLIADQRGARIIEVQSEFGIEAQD